MKLFATIAVAVNGYASNDICPSKYVTGDDNSGCYTQTEIWTTSSTATSLQCNMDNAACLPVTCQPTGIQAQFRYDLFDEGLEYLNLIDNGTRPVNAIKNGVSKALTASCNVNVNGNFLELDWNYADCQDLISAKMVGNQLEYSVRLESPGSDDSEVIEFYVDHGVEASCKYDTEIDIENNFWVNQEDVEAYQSENGSLADQFKCEFFSNPERDEKIESHNIVNMGDTLYGHVTSNALPGLSYELTDLVVSQGAQSFSVIDNGVPDFDTVQATTESGSTTGNTVDFSWMSFGFSSNPGNNQNKLTIECKVQLELSKKTAISCEWSNQVLEDDRRGTGYPNTSDVAEGSQRGHLLCPGGKTIKVISALYGRWSTAICHGFNYNVTNRPCDGHSDLTSDAQEQCDGQTECFYHGHNRVAGDPCRGTSKYTVVEYECQ